MFRWNNHDNLKAYIEYREKKTLYDNTRAYLEHRETRTYKDAFDFWTQMIPLKCLTDHQLIRYLEDPAFEDHIDDILDEMNERKHKNA